MRSLAGDYARGAAQDSAKPSAAIGYHHALGILVMARIIALAPADFNKRTTR
jgi:hypothetical protein